MVSLRAFAYKNVLTGTIPFILPEGEIKGRFLLTYRMLYVILVLFKG